MYFLNKYFLSQYLNSYSYRKELYTHIYIHQFKINFFHIFTSIKFQAFNDRSFFPILKFNKDGDTIGVRYKVRLTTPKADLSFN